MPKVVKSPKIAIVHDWLYGGGAEHVVEQLHLLYPEAPIYTSYCSPEWRKKLDNVVVTGYLQYWPFAKLRRFLPLLRQWWFKGIDLKEYDIVISSSGNGEAKFVRTASTTTHICYCHIPTHFYWSKYEEYLKNPSMRPYWLVRLGLRLLVKPLRRNDYAAAQHVDHFIANSTHTKNQIKQYYDRDSTIIFPPVNTDRFSVLATKRDRLTTETPRYIVWGRHVPYKRLDLVIAACNELGLPLTVLGSGPETPTLKALAGPTVTFAGRVSDEDLAQHILEADAFIFPAEEDFGIAPIEALSAGLPVIAYKAGGALDYIHDGSNGLFFEEQTTESLVEALTRHSTLTFNPKVISKSADTFSTKQFSTAMATYVNGITKESRS
ncbi:GDP-mannose-dependent alpha-(1-6)-phosphatidylinositol monomannoside mannosyltransferase [compost metagenome]